MNVMYITHSLYFLSFSSFQLSHSHIQAPSFFSLVAHAIGAFRCSESFVRRHIPNGIGWNVIFYGFFILFCLPIRESLGFFVCVVVRVIAPLERCSVQCMCTDWWCCTTDYTLPKHYIADGTFTNTHTFTDTYNLGVNIFFSLFHSIRRLYFWLSGSIWFRLNQFSCSGHRNATARL